MSEKVMNKSWFLNVRPIVSNYVIWRTGWGKRNERN